MNCLLLHSSSPVNHRTDDPSDRFICYMVVDYKQAHTEHEEKLI